MTPIPHFGLNKTHLHIKQAWADYKGSFVFFTGIFFALLVVSISLAKFPVIGFLLSSWFVSPLVCVGMAELVRAKRQGQSLDEVRLQFFFRGFKQVPQQWGEWLKLGLLQYFAYLGVVFLGALPIFLTLYLRIDGSLISRMFLTPISFFALLATGQMGQSEIQSWVNSFLETALTVFQSVPVWGWAFLVIWSLVAMQVFFFVYFAGTVAPFAVHFEKLPATNAFGIGLKLVFKNWFFYKWITFYYSFLFYIGLLLTLGLGFFVLVPLLTIFMPYVWFLEVFPLEKDLDLSFKTN